MTILSVLEKYGFVITNDNDAELCIENEDTGDYGNMLIYQDGYLNFISGLTYDTDSYAYRIKITSAEHLDNILKVVI